MTGEAAVLTRSTTMGVCVAVVLGVAALLSHGSWAWVILLALIGGAVAAGLTVMLSNAAPGRPGAGKTGRQSR
jgi:hypothetical protein